MYLVRHTEYLNPERIFPFHLPVFLSPEGRSHAKRIGEWFVTNNHKNIPIYSSRLVRTVQTAEIIASQTNSNVMIDIRLVEYTSPSLQGTKMSDVDTWKQEQEDNSRETYDSIKIRMKSILSEMLNKKEDCILISHGDPLTLLYYTIMNMQLPEFLWTPELEPICIQKGEIVQLEYNDNTLLHSQRINV